MITKRQINIMKVTAKLKLLKLKIYRASKENK